MSWEYDAHRLPRLLPDGDYEAEFVSGEVLTSPNGFQMAKFRLRINTPTDYTYVKDHIVISEKTMQKWKDFRDAFDIFDLTKDQLKQAAGRKANVKLVVDYYKGHPYNRIEKYLN